jgi:transposase
MPTEELANIWDWDAESVKDLRDLGVTITAIAKRFGKSRQAVYDLLKKDEEKAPAPTGERP